MGLLQFVNYMHNNLYRNDWPLYHAGLTFGTQRDGSSVFPPSLLFWQDVEFLPAMNGVATVGEYAYAY